MFDLQHLSQYVHLCKEICLSDVLAYCWDFHWFNGSANKIKLKYTIQNKLRTNCSQTCQRLSFELNDLKFLYDFIE